MRDLPMIEPAVLRLPCALALSVEQGCDGAAGKVATDLARGRSGELVDHCGVLLAEAARVEEDGLAFALEPALVESGA
jgi:hypothetical protein